MWITHSLSLNGGTSDPLTKAITPRIWTFGVDITL